MPVDAPADNSVSHRLHPFWLALHTEHGVEERDLLRGELCNAVFIVLHWVPFAGVSCNRM